MKRIAVAAAVVLVGCSSHVDSRMPTRTRGAADASPAMGPSVLGSAGSGPAGTSNAPASNGLISPASGTAKTDAINDPSVCASAKITATRITPTVQFVIDGSSSMVALFGTGTRWSVLRDTLIGPQGVVTTLASAVKFGMAIYGSNEECPSLTAVAPAVSNLMAMTTAYPNDQPGVGTPTGEALQKVVDGLPDFSMPGPDAILESAPIIILATDGEPNGCAGAKAATCDWVGDLANCIASVAEAPANYGTTFAAVRAAKAKKIPVWVVSLADGLNAIPDLQTTANIGAGLADDAMPGATIYSPQSSADLTMTLSTLIGTATSCDVKLAGKLDLTRACEGTVQINGSPLACNDPQGWMPVDESHIVLQGTACDRFKADLTVVLDAGTGTRTEEYRDRP
jgi:hypothetical protein